MNSEQAAWVAQHPLPWHVMAARDESTGPFCTMLSALGIDFLDAVIVHFTLRARRALACRCYQLRTQMSATLLHSPVLFVLAEDATWDNARYVSRRLVPSALPAPSAIVPLQRLCGIYVS